MYTYKSSVTLFLIYLCYTIFYIFTAFSNWDCPVHVYFDRAEIEKKNTERGIPLQDVLAAKTRQGSHNIFFPDLIFFTVSYFLFSSLCFYFQPNTGTERQKPIKASLNLYLNLNHQNIRIILSSNYLKYSST